MVRSAISPHILKQLERIEPGAQFSGGLPQISSSSGKTYFAKASSPKEKEQYIGEAESLRAMALAAPGLAPSLLAFGFARSNGEETDGDAADGSPFFISEYKNMSPLTERSGAILGRRLATEMHNYVSPNGLERGFGFGVPTFCGATRLRNGWYETWEQCFDVLIGDLLSTLEGRGGYSDLCRKGQDGDTHSTWSASDKTGIVAWGLMGGYFAERAMDLYADVLMQSGNTGTDTATGEPVIFDPSSLYGHNEADLAIGRMFGGIPKSFFEEYHKHIPKTEPVDQYELREDLYELFHYLNHTVLFGGGYASSAQRKMEKLLRVLG